MTYRRTITTGLPEGTPIHENVCLTCRTCGRTIDENTRHIDRRVERDGITYHQWDCRCGAVIEFEQRYYTSVNPDADYR